MKHVRRSTAVIVGAALIVAGAGIASARIIGGPPWSYEPVDADAMLADPRFDPNVLVTNVTATFDGLNLDEACTAAVMGDNEFGAAPIEEAEQLNVLLAYDALATALGSGQTSHMVQSTRVLLEKCDGSNKGLQNALAVHMRNWQRHYDHEMWLREKFAEKWPDGKPGGNPHVAASDETETTGTTETEKVHGNPHGDDGSPGNGNAFGHNR
jgi:hypothetical protein